MLLIILKKYNKTIDQELSKWLYSPKKNIYFGFVSAKIRDILWNKLYILGIENNFIYDSNTVQGFEVKIYGDMKNGFLVKDGMFFTKK